MAPIVGSAFQSQSQNPEGDETTWGQHLARALGVQFGHPVTSDAEQSAYDTLAARSGGEGRTPEQQQQHDNDKRWVGMLRNGQDDQVENEMDADPSMSKERGNSVFRRAAEKQGLAGLVSDSQLGPDDLPRLWGKATPAEREAMREGLEYRLSKAKPTSDAEADKWDALEKAVGE